MAATKHYTVEGKKIFANILALNAKELKEVKKYLELGFELVETQPKKLTKDERKAAAAEKEAAEQKQRKENPYSRINVEAFLKKPENKELYAEYQKRYNEQAGIGRKRKQKDGTIIELPDEPKYLKSGKPKVKGFANCIGWFTDMFFYDAEAKTYIRK